MSVNGTTTLPRQIMTCSNPQEIIDLREQLRVSGHRAWTSNERKGAMYVASNRPIKKFQLNLSGFLHHPRLRQVVW